MSESTCSVNGCERAPFSRGWCSMHYQRIWKYGDPDRVHPSGKPPRKKCQIRGCDRMSSSHGCCKMHYCRILRKGTSEPLPPSPVGCGLDWCDEPHESNGYCKEHSRRYRMTGSPLPVRRSGVEVCCNFCGTMFVTTSRLWRYCSLACGSAFRSWQRRSRKRVVLSEKFTRREIFERDGWICQLCNCPVDPALRWPDKMCASLDHITPVVLGGDHLRSNAQTSHLACNSRKGGRMVA